MQLGAAGLVVVAACGFSPAMPAATTAGSDAPVFVPIDTGVVATDSTDASQLGDGLIAWFEMESITSSTTADSTGHGHDGTCAQCPAVVAGHLGSGFSFDGATRIDVADVGSAFDTAGFTIAAWVNYQAAPTGEFGCPVGKVYDTTIYNSWELCIDKVADAWLYDTVHDATGFDSLYVAPAPAMNVWHHTAMTWDGTTKQLWIDGVSIGSAAAPVVVFRAGAPITFGADTDYGSQSSPFIGWMDDLRIYDHALSAVLIAALAAQ